MPVDAVEARRQIDLGVVLRRVEEAADEGQVVRANPIDQKQVAVGRLALVGPAQAADGSKGVRGLANGHGGPALQVAPRPRQPRPVRRDAGVGIGSGVEQPALVSLVVGEHEDRCLEPANTPGSPGRNAS